MRLPTLALLVLLVCSAALPTAGFTHSQNPVDQKALAEPDISGLFSQIRPAVFVLRTITEGSSEASGYGSAFFVDKTGYAVTSYHVVSDYARHPQEQRMEAVMANGNIQGARIVALDVVNDLALLKIDSNAESVPSVQVTAEETPLQIGTAIYAIGDPDYLGVTVMTGHYSGVLNNVGWNRLHFSGAINAGMSGGPTVDARGVLIGVNMGVNDNLQQVAFLIPARHVRALMNSGLASPAMDLAQVNSEIRRQLMTFQTDVQKKAFASAWPTEKYGPYSAPDFLIGRLNCDTDIEPNSGSTEESHRIAFKQVHTCKMPLPIAVDDSLSVGYVSYSHTYLKALTRNRFRFNTSVELLSRDRILINGNSEGLAKQGCSDRMTRAGRQSNLPVRLIFCAAAYREFQGLYNFEMNITTRDRPYEALVTHMTLEGVSWETALLYTSQLLRQIE